MAKNKGFLKITGKQVKEIRTKSGKNQTEFWAPLGVTQSGGSRYESGRNIPAPVSLLVALKNGTKKERIAALKASGIDLSDIAADILAVEAKNG